MKPQWRNAPAWANWLARDADGTWFWYEQAPDCIPSSGGGMWASPDITSRTAIAGADETWVDSIEKRP